MSGKGFPSRRMSIGTLKVKKSNKILGQLTSFLHNENSTAVLCDLALKDELGSMLASSEEQVQLVSV